MSIQLIKDMFDQMVITKQQDAIEKFYAPSFVMYSNGVEQGYEEFAASHRKVYDTAISYAVEYDEEAWVEGDDKTAGRVWITTARPDEKPTRIEVILIVAFEQGRISRVWETTWPSWTDLAAFENY